MSQDLLTQLAEYGTYCDERQGSVSADDVIDTIVPLPMPTHSTAPRRRWLVAVAAAALILIIIGGLTWLTPLSDTIPPSDTQTTIPQTTVPETTVPTTPDTTVPELTEPLSSSIWSRLPHDEAVFGGEGSEWMFDVTVGGPGLVAVGSDGSDAVVWTSVDGIAWLRVPHDDVVFGGAGMSSVTVGGPGLVAVGSADPHNDEDAVVWTSVDGITWSRVPHDESVFGGVGEQWMGSVTAGGPGLVAVGWDLVGFDADAAVWTSPDGVTWSRVPHDEEVFGGRSYQAMRELTAGGPGLVAVGEDRSRDFDDGDVAVWTSVDGITWSRVPHDEENLGEGQVTSVTSVGSGLVAVGNVGSDAGDDAAVWTSTDGITWSRVPHDEAVFAGAGMQSVTAGGPGLVAVGSDGEAAAVWVAVLDD